MAFYLLKSSRKNEYACEDQDYSNYFFENTFWIGISAEVLESLFPKIDNDKNYESKTDNVHQYT